MKFKSTWILAVVAVALGLYIYFVEIKKAEKDEEQKSAAEKIVNVDLAKVKSVTLKNSSGTFQLENDGVHWNLVEPVKDQADDEAVRGAINAINAEKYDDTIENEDPKNFGLDNPKSVITITTNDGKANKIAIGIDAPLPGKVYLQRNDEKKILYANAGFKSQLDKNLKDLRDKKIFRKNKDDIRHILLKENTKDNQSEIKLDKKDNDWTLVNVGEKADGDAVNGFLTNLDGLKAVDFPSEKGNDPAEMKKYGLDRPELVITLSGEKDELAKLLISPKKDNNIYVKISDRPTIYQAFMSAADTLHHKVGDFRDKKVPFQFNKDDVSEILMKTSLVDNHLVKKGNGWEMATPDSKKQVNQVQVTNLIERLGQLRVGEYLDKGAPKKLPDQNGTIVLKNAKGETLISIAWGDKAKSGKTYLTKTSKYPEVFGTDMAGLDGLPGQTLIEEKATPTPAPAASPATSQPKASEPAPAPPSGKSK